MTKKKEKGGEIDERGINKISKVYKMEINTMLNVVDKKINTASTPNLIIL